MRIDSAPGIVNGDRIALAAATFVRNPALAPLDVVLAALTESDATFTATDPSAADALPIATMVKVRIPGAGNPLGEVARADTRGIVVKFVEPLSPRVVARAVAAVAESTVIVPQMATALRGVASSPDNGVKSMRAGDDGAPSLDRPDQTVTLSAEALARFAASAPNDIVPADAPPEDTEARILAGLLALPITQAAARRSEAVAPWLLWGALVMIALLYILL